MKKLSSLSLCLVMLFCLWTPAIAADEEYPVVVVPGYSSSQLFIKGEDGSDDLVWWIGGEVITSAVLEKVVDIGIGLSAFAFGNPDYLAKAAGDVIGKLLGPLACNDDGTGINELYLRYTSAADTNNAALKAKGLDAGYIHEQGIMDTVADRAGDENVFNFNCDFRRGALECAAALDAYITDVLAYTGSDRVNLVAVSHGGQVAAMYFTLYGYKRMVNHAVLTVPAIGGAGLAADVISGNFDFDEEALVRFLEVGLISETDYNWLVQANQLGFLNSLLAAVKPYLREVLGNWTSIWDFIPTEYYGELKDDCLDKTANAAIIAASDYFHYTVMPMFDTALQKCNDDYGMRISVIAGFGSPVITGLKVSSDGILPVSCSTGAVAAPLGTRFADGYNAINGDNGYVSPSMTLDASTAYLPMNTWFIDGLFHGMEYLDSFSASLIQKLLFTDEIEDVYSSPDYPRFHASSDVSLAVFAKFDGSPEGHISSADSALIVRNLSEKYEMKLLAVTCDGIDIGFNVLGVGSVAAGESVSLPIEGIVPAIGMTGCDITLTYILKGCATPLNERTLSFTVSNGSAPEYDVSHPFVSVGMTPAHRALGRAAVLLEALGFGKITSIIYNILIYAVGRIR